MTYATVKVDPDLVDRLYKLTVRSQFRNKDNYEKFYSVITDMARHLDEKITDAKYNARVSTANRTSLKNYCAAFGLTHTNVDTEDIRRCVKSSIFSTSFDGCVYSRSGILNQLTMLTNGEIEHYTLPPRGFEAYVYIDYMPSKELIGNYKEVCKAFRPLGKSVSVHLVYKPRPNMSERTSPLGVTSDLSSWTLL